MPSVFFLTNMLCNKLNHFANFVVVLNHIVFILSHSTKAPNFICIDNEVFLFSVKYFDKSSSNVTF